VAGTLDLFQNIGCFGGPDKRFGMVVVLVDVVADGHDQFLDVAEDASLCTGEIIDLWEALWESHVGQKRPGNLSVAYLAGPNPLNDFRELVRNGVHPYSIWAFESESGLFNAALREIKASEFPLRKIYSSIPALLKALEDHGVQPDVEEGAQATTEVQIIDDYVAGLLLPDQR